MANVLMLLQRAWKIAQGLPLDQAQRRLLNFAHQQIAYFQSQVHGLTERYFLTWDGIQRQW